MLSSPDVNPTAPWICLPTQNASLTSNGSSLCAIATSQYFAPLSIDQSSDVSVTGSNEAVTVALDRKIPVGRPAKSAMIPRSSVTGKSGAESDVLMLVIFQGLLEPLPGTVN